MNRFLVFAIGVIAFAVLIVPRNAFRSPTLGTRAAQPMAAPVATPIALEPARSPLLGQETAIARAANGHLYADATVNGVMVHFVVDTGASIVALTHDDAQRIGLAVPSSGGQVIGSGASGPVTGTPVTLGEVELDGKRAANVQAAVLDGLGVSLLGQSYLNRLAEVRIERERMTLR